MFEILELYSGVCDDVGYKCVNVEGGFEYDCGCSVSL